MEHKDRRLLFQEKLRKLWKKKVNVPISQKELFHWICPKIDTDEKLNWSKWDSDVSNQEEGLKDLVESGSSFFLWKKTEIHKKDGNFKVISSKEATENFLYDMVTQEYSPLLKDEENKEENQKLIKSETHAIKKIKEAEAIYCLEENHICKAMAIISRKTSLYSSFRIPKASKTILDLAVEENKCEGIVYLDVIFARSEEGKRYGTRLLHHIENEYRNHIICLFSIPKRSTLYFYNAKGFKYSDMGPESINLLPKVLEKIDNACTVWHNGFPAMTQLHPESQLRRPSISVFSDDVNWQIRDNVNIYFDTDQSFYSSGSIDAKKIKKYIENTRTCQRIVIAVPRYVTSKTLYYTMCKKILYLAQDMLNDDESLEEIVVACDEHSYRHFLLKKAASYVWTQLKPEDLVNMDQLGGYQLLSPETK